MGSRDVASVTIRTRLDVSGLLGGRQNTITNALKEAIRDFLVPRVLNATIRNGASPIKDLQPTSVQGTSDFKVIATFEDTSTDTYTTDNAIINGYMQCGNISTAGWASGSYTAVTKQSSQIFRLTWELSIG